MQIIFLLLRYLVRFRYLPKKYLLSPNMSFIYWVYHFILSFTLRSCYPPYLYCSYQMWCSFFPLLCIVLIHDSLASLTFYSSVQLFLYLCDFSVLWYVSPKTLLSNISNFYHCIYLLHLAIYRSVCFFCSLSYLFGFQLISVNLDQIHKILL